MAGRALHCSYRGVEPDEPLREYLVGTLLGDGCLTVNGRSARYSDASSNEAYARWKHGFLQRYFHTTIRERLSCVDARTNKRYRAFFVRTSSHPLLSEWRAQWYRGHKVVPFGVVERYLSEFAFAVWLSDDGCNQAHSFWLYPLAFSTREVQKLRDLVNHRFNLTGKLLKNSYGRPYIRFPARDLSRIHEILERAALPGMGYKAVVRMQRRRRRTA